MERNKFIFYKDWWEALQQMPEEMSRAIIEAIMNYALYGIESDDPQIKYSIYALAKAQIDRDTSKYDEISRKRREAGRKGGAPKGNQNAAKQANQANACFDKQNNQLQANQTNQANNNDSNNDIDNNIDNDNNNNFPPKGVKLNSDDDTSTREGKKNPLEIEDEMTARLLSQYETAYWEQTAMGLSISKVNWKIDDIRAMLTPFQEGNKAKGNFHTDINDLKRHFYDWLKIQVDWHRKNKNKNKQSDQQPISPLHDYIAERLGKH